MYYLVKSFHRKVYTKLHVVNSIILKVNFMTRSHVEWVDVILKRNSRSIETFLFLLRIALSSKNRNKFATARKITRMTKCELPKTFWLQLHIWSIFLFWQFLKFFVDLVDDIFDYFSDPNWIKMKLKIISTSDQIASSDHSHSKKTRLDKLLFFFGSN